MLIFNFEAELCKIKRKKSRKDERKKGQKEYEKIRKNIESYPIKERKILKDRNKQ